MSMSTDISFGKGDSSKYDAFLAAEEACKKAGVPVPHEIQDYLQSVEFNGEYKFGVLWDYQRTLGDNETEDGVTAHYLDSSNEWVIDIEKLPKDIRYVRIRNSW